MPLQNRVDPFGAVHAVPERGLFMGNRGGRIHDPETRILTGRPHVSRRWICCVLEFKGRHRPVMGHSYTELFFLDEVTALAAGHRPCFECRRADARAFAAAWAAAESIAAPGADAMDVRLRGERGRRLLMAAGDLPDGAVYAVEDAAFAVRAGHRLRFGFGGWQEAGRRPDGRVAVLTPPAVLGVLRSGYAPRLASQRPFGVVGASCRNESALRSRRGDAKAQRLPETVTFGRG